MKDRKYDEKTRTTYRGNQPFSEEEPNPDKFDEETRYDFRKQIKILPPMNGPQRERPEDPLYD